MKIFTMIIILACFGTCTVAQVAPQKYFVEFMDKSNSPFSVTRPNEFLSQRAIDRRQRQGIAVVENDIPVNQSYVNRIMACGAQVLTRSKWFNGVTIYCLNPAIIDSILLLPFVNRVLKNGYKNSISTLNPGNKFMLEEVLLKNHEPPHVFDASRYNRNSGYDYGPSYNQIHMVNGDSLHKLGLRGEGMVIAVLDAGFLHVDNLPAFDSLRANNQILGTKDFVHPGNNVYLEYEHGMEVLSCMGGNLPGQLIGTAPKAGYWLLRSEDFNTEYIIEEYNWVSAAEFADSAGADVINSSLGYTEFNDMAQNHTCQDMNGNTTPVTKGANLASGKGMLVVCSAGNSGETAWKCIGAPADGYGVLTVAAVNASGIRAPFSSLGEATTRIKPNVAAMGQGVVVASTAGNIMVNNGTSFAAPIIAGMAACLWQSSPGFDNQSVIRAMELSGNQASTPDSLLGYGIPDVIKALKHVNTGEQAAEVPVSMYPNPFNETLSASFHAASSCEFTVFLYNNLGQVVYTRQGKLEGAGEHLVSFTGLPLLPVGTYIVQLAGKDFLYHTKVVKVGI